MKADHADIVEKLPVPGKGKGVVFQPLENIIERLPGKTVRRVQQALEPIGIVHIVFQAEQPVRKEHHGIVGINLLTVSYGSTASRLETQIQTLERKNTILRSSEMSATSMPRVREAALAGGMVVPETDEIVYRSFSPGDFAAAAQRLAADGG